MFPLHTYIYVINHHHYYYECIIYHYDYRVVYIYIIMDEWEVYDTDDEEKNDYKPTDVNIIVDLYNRIKQGEVSIYV